MEVMDGPEGQKETAMSDFAEFDRYCDEKGIQPGDEPAAFAAFLNERTGWDGPMRRKESDEQ